MRASAAFYVEALGFRVVAEPPGWIFVERDASLAARGVEVIHAIRDEPWGMRELGIRTPDGHRIMLGEAIPER